MILTKHEEGILRALIKLDKLARNMGIVLPKPPVQSKEVNK